MAGVEWQGEMVPSEVEEVGRVEISQAMVKSLYFIVC